MGLGTTFWKGQMSARLALLLVLLFGYGSVRGQGVPKFEVSVVKENKSGAGGMKSMNDPQGLTATNVTLRMLLRQAYGLYTSNDEMITGLPKWAETKHFDVQARVSSQDADRLKHLTVAGRMEMLRALLEQRFGLQARKVKVEAPVYALVVAKGGPKMEVWKGGEVAGNGLPVSDARAGGGYSWSDGELKATGVKMDELPSVLTQETGRTVVNETGLAGMYDFTLHWTPTEDSDAGADNGKAAGPGLFTALQEQLGLRLEAKRGLVDGVVVERLEMPGAN